MRRKFWKVKKINEGRLYIYIKINKSVKEDNYKRFKNNCFSLVRV